jgi:DHA1 family bicyclomycin/chloramphenicol resistance-like MFS transporter
MNLDFAAKARCAASPDPVPRAPLWLLALITFTGTMAMHIFVPALPAVAADFDASPGTVQMTLSFYIVGLALGQLVYGPISDRFGRRPVLILGTVVYTLAGVVAMLAPTIGTLITARLFQALGGCAGLVLGRAIVRDNASGGDAARNLSLMNLMTMVGPGLSPLVGAGLVATTGWRSIFVALCALGVANLLVIWRRLAESGGGRGQDTVTVLRNYVQLLRSRRFISYAVGGSCATTAFYAFVGAAPFIFVHQLGRPAHEVGVYLALNIVGVWLGSFTASRLVKKVPIGRLLVLGNLLSCAGAAIFLIAVLSGALSVPLTLLPILVLTYGAGIASPMALTEALSINPQVAGSASGLYGFAQMGIGAVCTSLAGIGDNPALATGIVLLSAGLLAQLSFWTARRAPS